LHHDECQVDEPFIDNGVLQSIGRVYNGDLQFSWSYPPGRLGYKTITEYYGHPFGCYGNTPNNVNKALRRLTCKRKPTKRHQNGQLLHDYCEQQQQRNAKVGNRRWRKSVRKYFDCIADRLLEHYKDYTDQYSEILKQANLKHPKRKLRQRAFRFLVESGLLYDDLFMKNISGVVKCPEYNYTIGPDAKKTRIIGDYTTEGSLRAGFIIPYLKKCFEDGWQTQKGKFAFVSTPDRNVLSSCFYECWNPDLGLVGYYFSDDGILCIVCVDGVYRCNIDISSCDISNGKEIFDLLQYCCRLCPEFDHIMRMAIRQCSRHFVVRNPYDFNDRYVFKPSRPVEFSGSVLTTSLNNIAMSLIFLRMLWNFPRGGLTVAQCAQFVQDSANQVGYIVTIQPVLNLEDYQFLKYSPTEVNGRVVPFLNLGPILRGIGQCDIDYPGRGDIAYRGYVRSSSVVLGFEPTGRHEVMQALRDRFHGSVKPLKESYIVARTKELDDDPYIPLEGLARRYKVAVEAFQEFIHLLRFAPVGIGVTSSLLTQIYQVDYG